MIAKLTGRIDALEDGRCIIDVNGVGYLVHASARTLAALSSQPALASLLIETQVREDAITLFGFAEAAERQWFRLLTAVQGVGAKLALGILSALPPDELATAIAAGDRAHLTRVPGVGAKLAIRLLTELREKVGTVAPADGLTRPSQAPVGVAGDALSALINLGYRRQEAEPAVVRTLERLGEGAGVDAVIRDSLRALAQRSMA